MPHCEDWLLSKLPGALVTGNEVELPCPDWMMHWLPVADWLTKSELNLAPTSDDGIEWFA